MRSNRLPGDMARWAVGEDDAALLLAPVVDDVGHYVEVAAGGDAFKEAAGDQLDTFGHAA
jgi:hypothetical protein